MSITFTTSTNGLGKDARGMTLACTQAVTTARSAKSTSASSTDKPTGLLSCIREFIHWLALGMFLGCALNMNAEVTDYKSNKQSWHCVEKECTNGKKVVLLADAPSSSSRIAPPSEIYVEGQAYSLTVKPDVGTNLLGTTIVATKEIAIRAGQSLASERDTVLHEVIHCAFGSDTKDLLWKKWGEEPATYKLTPRLLRILRDNPRLVEYLTQP